MAEPTDEQCAAIAKRATRLGAEIIGEYGDERGLEPETLGLAAMHAAVFSLVRAGWSPDNIGGLAQEHAVKVIGDIRALYEGTVGEVH